MSVVTNIFGCAERGTQHEALIKLQIQTGHGCEVIHPGRPKRRSFTAACNNFLYTSQLMGDLVANT